MPSVLSRGLSSVDHGEELTIAVLSHRIELSQTGVRYAVYRIRTAEKVTVRRLFCGSHARPCSPRRRCFCTQDFAIEVDRRWTHVRTLYYELWDKWRAQLQRSDARAPSFTHHAYLIGTSKLDGALLLRRERQ